MAHNFDYLIIQLNIKNASRNSYILQFILYKNVIAVHFFIDWLIFWLYIGFMKGNHVIASVCERNHLMSINLNSVTFSGFVGKEPEIRTFQNGDKVANFSVAETKSWKDKTTGERKEKTTWMNIAVFGKRADFIQKYVSKGMNVFITGRLENDTYEKDGQTHTVTKIVVRPYAGEIQIAERLEKKAEEETEAEEGEDMPF